MNSVNDANRVGWSLVGDSLDVVSLANASMVCKIWNLAFGDHPKWEYYYRNSNEFLLSSSQKVGKWRVLYGELFNRCKLLMSNTWKVEKFQPAKDEYRWGIKCKQCFYVDEKIVILGCGNLFALSKQIKALGEGVINNPESNDLEELEQYLLKPQSLDTIVVNPEYIKVILPEGKLPDEKDDGSWGVHTVKEVLIDKNYIYASVRNGPIIKWKKEEFPHGCMRMFPNGSGSEPPLDFKIQNEILYLLYPNFLTTYKNSEKLWGLDLPQGVMSNILINNNLGAIVESSSDETIPGGILYLWDSRMQMMPQKIGTVKKEFVLLANEVICATDDAIIAYSLEGSRLIYKMDCKLLSSMVASSDQDIVYLISEKRYLSTLSISEKKLISSIDLGNQDISNVKFFNGILYCISNKGRLLLIHPQRGIIRKGPKKMFHGPSVEVHNGMVFGVNLDEDAAVILRPSNIKTIKSVYEGIKEKIKGNK